MRPDCGQSGHVKASADLAAPGEKDPSFSALLAAVAIVRGEPGKRHSRRAWDLIEFREESQNRLRGHGFDAGERLHEAAFAIERLVAAGERADAFFDQGKLVFQRRKMVFKAYANRLQGGVFELACLSLDHVLEFGAPSSRRAAQPPRGAAAGSADARSMGAMTIEAEFGSGFQHRVLVAAGRLSPGITSMGPRSCLRLRFCSRFKMRRTTAPSFCKQSVSA